MLSVGIVGLPNAGKSTLWNALTAGDAKVSSYPFTTIDANVGVAAVPDERLETLRRILEPSETTPSTIEFVDIAGLVEGASRGEGLGNRFLGSIRQVDAVAHVLRAFREDDVAHPLGRLDPAADAAVVETELLLADLELLERAIEKREREWKAAPRGHAAERERLEGYRAALEAGRPLRTLEADRETRLEWKTLGLLTGKPVLWVANVSEDELDRGVPQAIADLAAAAPGAAGAIAVSARIEWELRQLEPAERAEFARELGLERSGLELLVERSFELLGLIRFYTAAHGKLTAWAIEHGTPAPAAAGRIHGDMERGFIRARVAEIDDLVRAGSLQELGSRGKVRTEGRGYEIRDGDLVEFLFQPG